MRGRGDIIEALPARGVGRVSGRRILVFKPGFGIPTPWAYAQLAAKAPSSYLPCDEVEKRLAAWLASEAPVEDLLLNSMEPPAFTKFPALPVLLDRLRREFGLHARMSGSGSACFAVYDDELAVAGAVRVIRESWGESALVVQTRLQ
jgi:4-diphosphocytidyl-2-C-methyl-D-erythritol kinase